MKTRISIMTTFVLFLAFMTACSHQSDDTSVSGNGSVGVSSDGSTVTLNGSVEGTTLNMQVKDITRNCSYYSCTIRFQLGVNGTVGYGNLTPSNYDYGQTTPFNGFQVQGNAACYDSKCDNVLLVLTFTPNNQNLLYDPQTEYKRVAIRRDMVSNKIVNVKEYLARKDSLPSIQTLLSTL